MWYNCYIPLINYQMIFSNRLSLVFCFLVLFAFLVPGFVANAVYTTPTSTIEKEKYPYPTPYEQKYSAPEVVKDKTVNVEVKTKTADTNVVAKDVTGE
jgi:hypothetical protein